MTFQKKTNRKISSLCPLTRWLIPLLVLLLLNRSIFIEKRKSIYKVRIPILLKHFWRRKIHTKPLYKLNTKNSHSRCLIILLLHLPKTTKSNIFPLKKARLPVNKERIKKQSSKALPFNLKLLTFILLKTPTSLTTPSNSQNKNKMIPNTNLKIVTITVHKLNLNPPSMKLILTITITTLPNHNNKWELLLIRLLLNMRDTPLSNHLLLHLTLFNLW